MTGERNRRQGRKYHDRVGIAILAVIVLGLAYLTYAATQRSRRARELPNAVHRNDVAAVQALLDQGCYTRQSGEEALMWCVSAGSDDRSHAEILRALLDHGIGPNVKNTSVGPTVNRPNPISMLQLAVARGNVEATRLLLEHGADANEKPGDTPLLAEAITFNHPEIVDLLLAHGAQPNVIYEKPPRTAMGPAMDMRNWAIIRTLLAHGGDPNTKDWAGNPLIVIAAQGGDASVVHDLLDRGANVNAKDAGSMTALIEAAWNGKTDIARLLLDKGADANADNGYVSVLWYAVDHQHADIVKLLLARGANPNGKVNILNTARERRNTQIIDMLKRAGAKR